MKKIVYMAAALLLTMAVTSCSKEDIGNTATESMAGEWYCTVDAVDESGNPIDGGEDYWGLEAATGNARTRILTYNTTANDPTQLWVNILGIGNFAADYKNPDYPNYDFKIKTTCNQSAMTFAATEAENIADPVIWSHEEEDENGDTKEVIDAQVDPMPVTIEGKILKGAGRQNNGTPADSIIIYVTYKDDPWYPDDGYAKYKISGIRYSGLAEND